MLARGLFVSGCVFGVEAGFYRDSGEDSWDGKREENLTKIKIYLRLNALGYLSAKTEASPVLKAIHSLLGPMTISEDRNGTAWQVSCIINVLRGCVSPHKHLKAHLLGRHGRSHIRHYGYSMLLPPCVVHPPGNPWRNSPFRILPRFLNACNTEVEVHTTAGEPAWPLRSSSAPATRTCASPNAGRLSPHADTRRCPHTRRWQSFLRSMALGHLCRVD